jgi:hypothetical protein
VTCSGGKPIPRVVPPAQNGMTTTQVADGMLTSTEAEQDLVKADFQRTPDSFGFNLSMQALINGFGQEGLVAVLLGSDEYFASGVDLTATTHRLKPAQPGSAPPGTAGPLCRRRWSGGGPPYAMSSNFP